MNKLLILITVTLLLLTGCDHSNRELAQARYDGHQEGIEEGKKAGFKTCEQSISKAAETLAAQIKMKNEVIDRQRESELEKALACSNSLINLCPDSWMVDIKSYQKMGYSGTAGKQTYWIGLTNKVIPAVLTILFLGGLAMIYKLLKLEGLAKKGKELDLAFKELGLAFEKLDLKNAELDGRIANFTAEENQALRLANRERLIEEAMLNEVRTKRRHEEGEFEFFKSECLLVVAEREKEIDRLYAEAAELMAKNKLFGG